MMPFGIARTVHMATAFVAPERRQRMLEHAARHHIHYEGRVRAAHHLKRLYGVEVTPTRDGTWDELRRSTE
jgi:hypothetical protein